MDNMQQRFEALKPGVTDVVDAALVIADIFGEHPELTCEQITEGFKLAITGGHERLSIQLCMVMIAVEKARPDPPESEVRT